MLSTFDTWPTSELSAQCKMQARENLDPEYSAFMTAVADRLNQAQATVAETVETAVAAERERCCNAFVEAMAKGYPTEPSPSRCEHLKAQWEDCIACYDNTLADAIEVIRAPKPSGSQDGRVG